MRVHTPSPCETSMRFLIFIGMVLSGSSPPPCNGGHPRPTATDLKKLAVVVKGVADVKLTAMLAPLS